MSFELEEITHRLPQCPEHGIALKQETFFRGQQTVIAGWRCPEDNRVYAVKPFQNRGYAI